MNERQSREFDSIVRVQQFLGDQPRLPPELVIVERTLRDVVKRVTHWRAVIAGQRGTRFGLTVTQQADVIRVRHMIPLGRRGKVIFRGEPRLERAMRVPHKRATPAEIVAKARQMIAAITPHKRLFIAAGSPPTFLADLRSAMTQLQANVKLVDRARSAAPHAYVELKRELARGRAEVFVAVGLVRVWLDGLGPSQRGGLAEAWRSAHRITARQGRPSARRVENRKRREGAARLGTPPAS